MISNDINLKVMFKKKMTINYLCTCLEYHHFSKQKYNLVDQNCQYQNQIEFEHIIKGLFHIKSLKCLKRMKVMKILKKEFLLLDILSDL